MGAPRIPHSSAVSRISNGATQCGFVGHVWVAEPDTRSCGKKCGIPEAISELARGKEPRHLALQRPITIGDGAI